MISFLNLLCMSPSLRVQALSGSPSGSDEHPLISQRFAGWTVPVDLDGQSGEGALKNGPALRWGDSTLTGGTRLPAPLAPSVRGRLSQSAAPLKRGQSP